MSLLAANCYEFPKFKENYSSHQHADVHRQIDLAPSAVIGSGPEAGQDPLGFTNVTGGVVCMDVSYTYIINHTKQTCLLNQF